MASDSGAGAVERRVNTAWISRAGVLIVLLSAGAALLPLGKGIPDSLVVGGMLLAGGIVELLASTQRTETKSLGMLTGGVTVLAGLLFLTNGNARFLPTVNLVIGWLVLRCIILAIAGQRSHGSIRRWTIIAAGTDFLLALVLLAGLTATTFVVTLFGPTPALVATFAWVLALSFIATGLLLLEVANCEREAAEGEG
jgi:hypothetical protein